MQALNTDLDIELLELKCNVHPIDGIAKTCADLLKVYDEQNNLKSDCYGFGSCVVNFIYAMTKMRYKQGKGDPAGFKMFMRQENIKPSVIVRHVGNRFHVLFDLAGILYVLRDKLMLYLENVCHNTTTLRTALIQDLKNRTIISTWSDWKACNWTLDEAFLCQPAYD